MMHVRYVCPMHANPLLFFIFICSHNAVKDSHKWRAKTYQTKSELTLLVKSSGNGSTYLTVPSSFNGRVLFFITSLLLQLFGSASTGESYLIISPFYNCFDLYSLCLSRLSRLSCIFLCAALLAKTNKYF